MRKSLPKFEGHDVNGSVVKFTGSKQYPVFAFDTDEEVVFMVKARVKGVNHVERHKVGVVREHSCAIETVMIPDQKAAKEQLADLLDEYEERHGEGTKLPFKDEADGKSKAAGDD